VDNTKAPEFDLDRPIQSALHVLRAVFLAPKKFYLNFPADGFLKEPVAFVLLVSAVTAILNPVVLLVNGAISGVEVNLLGLVGLNAAFLVLSPGVIGVASGVYLLSVKTFVGKDPNFAQIFRILAYAYGPMVLFWLPVVNALVFAYSFMVLVVIGLQSVYQTPFLTALVTALVGFVPVSLAYMLYIVYSGSVAFL
jgi:hypothetical protein